MSLRRITPGFAPVTFCCLLAARPVYAQQRFSGAADAGLSYGSARVGSAFYGDFAGGRVAASFRAQEARSFGLFDEFAIESVQATRPQTSRCANDLPPKCLSSLPVVTQWTALFGALVKRKTIEGRVAVGTGGILARDDAGFHGLAYTALLDGVWFLHPRLGVGLGAQRAVLSRSPDQSLYLEQLRLTMRYRWPQ